MFDKTSKVFFNLFYCLYDAMHKRGYWCHYVSVTCWYCIKTDIGIIIFFLSLLAPHLWFSNTTYGC